MSQTHYSGDLARAGAKIRKKCRKIDARKQLQAHLEKGIYRCP